MNHNYISMIIKIIERMKYYDYNNINMLIIDSDNWRTLIFDMLMFLSLHPKSITMTINIDPKSVFVLKVFKFKRLRSLFLILPIIFKIFTLDRYLWRYV